MPSIKPATYDENLLASAPIATKAQLQDGYNPDILVDKNASLPTPKSAGVVDPEAANRVQTPVQRQQSDSLIKEKKRPFYTTKKGIIFIVVAVLVIIIVAVVGGVVGSRKARNGASSQDDSGSAGAKSVTSNLPSGSGQVIQGSTATTRSSTPTAVGGQSFGASTPTPSLPSSQGTGSGVNG